ncbi:pilus assembly PilX family protein [Imhoffiella purpurea]|uniref:pilus assembly PilX family protein n=1 Tax=Imhoffiella purpurea TaxID=1249627 RepID=UPI0018DFC42E|nr:PilX N-terminal domain-containing pilus assembly protein [Imhoffiella purpurea]
MKISVFQFRRQQKGAVLMISLILLVLLTIIGITAILSSSLDERMAANARARNLAFQAAESALRQGERFVLESAWDKLKDDVSSQHPNPDDDDAWTNINWDKQKVYTGPIGDGTDDVVARPSYVIEKLTATGSSLTGRDMTGIYRVTAYGQGSTATAVVVLERIVRRTKTN